jgi:hypothetical protein
VEFSEFGFDDLRECMAGDIARGIEDGAEDLGLETGCIECCLAWLNPTAQPHKFTSVLGWL